MHILIDANGIELKLGDIVTDFRGDEWTLTGFTRPRHPGSTGRVHLQSRDGELTSAEFYPGVIDAKIVEVPAELHYAFGVNVVNLADHKPRK